MKLRFIFYFFIFFVVSTSIAQTSSKFVRMSTLDKGVLFFVNPIELKNKNNQLSIDFTYPCYYQKDKDSVTVNFSLFGKNPILQINSLEFYSEKMNFNITSQRITKFFVEKKGNTWNNRYSAKISAMEFQQLIAIQNIINLRIKDNKESLYIFETDTKWIKISKVANELIMLNSTK
jgi:hypothetical protein